MKYYYMITMVEHKLCRAGWVEKISELVRIWSPSEHCVCTSLNLATETKLTLLTEF